MLGNTDYSIIDIARITIELTAPLSIQSGELDLLSDAAFVRDVQGLPTIPATSITGVLRSLWERAHQGAGAAQGSVSAETLFGFQNGDQGARSLCTVSSATIHTSEDRPIAPLVDWGDDQVLRSAFLDQVTRDHVRLNHRGVVDGHGKFNRSSVPKGHRFTFELSLRRSDSDPSSPKQSDFETLLRLLHSSVCRFGGKTRSGQGEFEVIRCLNATFDLRDPQSFEQYLSLPVALHESSTSFETYRPDHNSPLTSLRLALSPQEHWLQGGGDISSHADGDGKGPKIVPYQELSVTWDAHGKPKVKRDSKDKDYVLTATSIRGALRHRTAFHFRRLIQHWSVGDIVSKPQQISAAGGDIDHQDPAALIGLDMLFGQVHDSQKELGWRGALLTSDARVIKDKVKEATFDHLTIDRFTGEPMSGHLFSDVALAPSEERLDLRLGFAEPLMTALLESESREGDRAAALRVACYALHLALKDLSAGRLQLGAGAGRGYGYFEAPQVTWTGANTPWLSALNGVLNTEDLDRVSALNEQLKPCEGA